ncbi:MAG: flagellar basal body-associated FliL family protein [Pseudomonadota bacterium]
MKLLVPLLLALLGLAGGLAAGHALRPAPPPETAGAEAPAPDDASAAETPAPPQTAGPVEPHPDAPPPPHDPEVRRDYVELDRQFVVPLVQGERVEGLMILSLSVEVEEGLSDEVFTREPKLRDRFLRALFRHAQSGAFDGVFTAGPAMRDLRGSLLEEARSVLGPIVHDVLVTDILRQEV